MNLCTLCRELPCVLHLIDPNANDVVGQLAAPAESPDRESPCATKIPTEPFAGTAIPYQPTESLGQRDGTWPTGPQGEVLHNGLGQVHGETFAILVTNVFDQHTLNKKAISPHSNRMIEPPERRFDSRPGHRIKQPLRQHQLRHRETER